MGWHGAIKDFQGFLFGVVIVIHIELSTLMYCTVLQCLLVYHRVIQDRMGCDGVGWDGMEWDGTRESKGMR